MLSFILTLVIVALIIWGLAWYFTGKEQGPLKTGISIEKNEFQSNDDITNLLLKGNQLKSSRRFKLKEGERRKRDEKKNKKDLLKQEEKKLKGAESEIGNEPDEDGEESNEPQLKEKIKEQPRFELKEDEDK